MPKFLITGCSRSLGLALAKQPSEAGHTVIATSRGSPTPAPQSLTKSSQGRCHHFLLDVTDRDSVTAAEKSIASFIGDQGIDVLIKKCGSDQLDDRSAADKPPGQISTQYFVFITSARILTSPFLPLLSKGSLKKVINMMAVTVYKVSKAALNMLTVQYAQIFAEQGFTFLAVSPGWLRTDLGGQAADLDVETGAITVIEVIQNHGPEANGSFVNIRVAGWEENEGLNQYYGKVYPW